MSQPDIARAERSVARRAYNTNRKDWKAGTKTLGYFRGTKDLGFKLTGEGAQLGVNADSRYATDREDGKSVSVGEIIYGDSCVGWFSTNRIRCVSTLSTEAEYISVARCPKLAMLIYHILDFVMPGERVPLRLSSCGRITTGQSVFHRTR